MFYLTRHNYPPIKLIPPFRATDAYHQLSTGEYVEVELCTVEVGRHYMGLRGGSHCSEYEIEVEVFYDHDANCTEMEHDTDLQTSEEATTLVLDHFMLGSCAPACVRGLLHSHRSGSEGQQHDRGGRGTDRRLGPAGAWAVSVRRVDPNGSSDGALSGDVW